MARQVASTTCGSAPSSTASPFTRASTWVTRSGAATSAGQGVAAAMEMEKYLADLEDRTYPGREETYAEVEMAA